MKGVKDEHYEEYLNPEYCGHLLRRKAFRLLMATVAIGNIIITLSWALHG